MASFEGSIGTPDGRFNLMVEYSISQSTEGNYSDISATGYVKRNSSSVYPYNGYGGDGNLSIDGDNKYESVPYDLRSDGYKQIMSHSKRVYHNSDGTKGITISFSFNGNLSSYYPNGSISQYITLPTIPRYFSRMPSMSVTSKTETSITIAWSTSENASRSQYKINNGSWVDVETNINKSSGTMTITGLQAGTTYTIYGDFMRRDSGLWCQTKPSLEVSTYDYPHVTTTPTFYIGDAMYMSLYNPLGRTCTATMYGDDGSTIWSSTGWTGTSIGANNTQSDINNFYASILNKSSGTYRIKIVYGNSTRNATGTYYAKENDCKALLSMSVIDTNSDITTLLGSNTKFLKYLSKPQVTLTPITRYGASIIGQTISLGDGQYANSLNYTFNKIDSDYVSGTVRDSRGFYTTVDTTLDMIDYIKLAITKFELSKPEGTSNEVKITLEGNWFNEDFVENTHNTLSINVDYKISTSGTWTNYGSIASSITGNTFKITNLSLGSIYDFDKEYQFKVTVSDLVDEINEIESIRGQEVIAIGDGKTWFYGDVFINDCSLVNEYSTSEVKTHEKWIDGKPIYRKVVYVNELPNGLNDNGIKSITTGISDMEHLVNMYGTYTGTGNHYYEKYPINYIRRDNSLCDISTEYGYYDGAMSIIIRSTMGSGYKGYVILEYTKTTD